MEASPIERRLVVILAADVAGYSRLVAEDDEWTLRTLGTYRSTIIDLSIEYNGRVFGTAGDSVMVEFASALEAVRAAVAIQQVLQRHNAELPHGRRMEFRIGIDLGEVIAKGNELLGDGVNIAARLQEIASPAGICLSGSVLEQIEGKFTFPLAPLGERSLKNIPRRVAIYRVDWEVDVPAATALLGGVRAPLPDKLSVAVLPFTDMSDDPDQQYFSDGVTADITTELSRFRQLFVIAVKPSPSAGSGNVGRQIARDYGVRYLLDGSVRRSRERVRISARLIDATTGGHVWAERFDRTLAGDGRDMVELFAAQDGVVQTIVGTLVGRVQAAGVELAKRRPPASLAAYDCVLRGNALPWGDPQSTAGACRMYERAIELDPGYGLAHARLAVALYHIWSLDMTGSNAALDRAFELAKYAVELDENESQCQFALGHVHLFRRQFGPAEHYHRLAIEMNPNNPEHMADMAGLLVYLGKPGEAIEWLNKARRIDPYFRPAWYWHQLGTAHFTGRCYDDAIAAFERASTMPFYAQAYIAASHAQMARMDRAKECAGETLRQKPDFSVRVFVSKEPYKVQADLENLLDGLCKAGFSE